MKWARMCKIGDLCQASHGSTPSTAEERFWGGSLPWVSPKDMWVDRVTDAEDHLTELATTQARAPIAEIGSILIVVRSGILVRRLPIAIVDRTVSFNQDIKALLPDKTKLLPEYLWRFLQSREQEVLVCGVKKGATVHSVKSGYIEGLQIPLPALREQARIVELLDQADGLRRQRAEADAKLARLLPALFRHHFGDPETNPQGHDMVDFDDAFDDVSAGETKLQTKSFLAQGLLPIIDQGAQPITGYTDDLSVKFTGSTPVIIFGDHTRNFKFVDHDFAIGADGVRVLSAKRGFVPEFLYWHCRLLNIPSAGYSRHMKYLKAKRFLAPDISTQNVFAQAAKTAREIETQAAASAAKLEVLFQTLLHRAFTGELTASWREAHLRESVQEIARHARV